MAGLYIHIPFCRGRCPYCDFYSIVADEETMLNYPDLISAEAELISIGLRGKLHIETIYIGGGTPSINQKVLTEIIHTVKCYFDTTEVTEFTIEVNPEDVANLEIDALKNTGINRVSLGVQSLDDKQLKVLGRRTNEETIQRAYYKLRDSGVDNVSIDLIYGLTEGGMRVWDETLDRVASMKPDHISIYELSIREDNPMLRYKAYDDEVVTMYSHAISKLTSAGYRHYEISNLALNDRFCLHNLNYWKCGEYMGLGPSASSFLNGVRYTNYRDLDLYHHAISRRQLPIEHTEVLNEERRAREAMVLALRLVEGVDIEEFKKKYHYDAKILLKDIPAHIKCNLINENYDRISLTPMGLTLSDELFAYLI